MDCSLWRCPKCKDFGDGEDFSFWSGLGPDCLDNLIGIPVGVKKISVIETATNREIVFWDREQLKVIDFEGIEIMEPSGSMGRRNYRVRVESSTVLPWEFKVTKHVEGIITRGYTTFKPPYELQVYKKDKLYQGVVSLDIEDGRVIFYIRAMYVKKI